MPFIDVIQPGEAKGKLKEIYRQLEQSRGKIAEVHKIQSLNPESIPRHMDLYMTLMFGKSPLKRYQREMIAVVVSAANQCEYCQLHHGEALNHFWKDEAKIEKLRDDYATADLEEADALLCKVAEQLTRDPSSGNKEAAEELRAAGFSDRAILDVTLIVSYFNFVNRMVMALGVEPDQEEVRGYKYE